MGTLLFLIYEMKIETISIKDLVEKKYLVATMYINRQLQEGCILDLTQDLEDDGIFIHSISLVPAKNFLESGLPFLWKGKAVRREEDLDKEGQEALKERRLFVTYDGHHRQRAINEYCKLRKINRKFLENRVRYDVFWDLTGNSLKNAWNKTSNHRSIPGSSDDLAQIVQVYNGLPEFEFDRALLSLLSHGIPDTSALSLVSWGHWGYRKKDYLKKENLVAILGRGSSAKHQLSKTVEGYEKSMLLVSVLEKKIIDSYGKCRKFLPLVHENKLAFMKNIMSVGQGSQFYNKIEDDYYQIPALGLTSLDAWKYVIDFATVMIGADEIKEYFEIESRQEGEDSTATFRRQLLIQSMALKYRDLGRTKEDVEISVEVARKEFKKRQDEISDYYAKLDKNLKDQVITRKQYLDNLRSFKSANFRKLQLAYYNFARNE